MFVWMFAHSFQDLHLGFICLRNWLRSFVWVFIPAHFCENIVQFSRYYLRFLFQKRFYILAASFLFVKNFFSAWLLQSLTATFIILLNLLPFVKHFFKMIFVASAYVCMTFAWRQLFILATFFCFCKLFLKFIEVTNYDFHDKVVISTFIGGF